MQKFALASWSDLEPLKPTYALAAGVDMVVIRWPDQDQVSVLYGRCAHRGALMSDGRVEGGNIVCGLHDWDYCYKTGVSSYNPAERLHRFNAWVTEGQVWVDGDEIRAWAVQHPQPYDRAAYQGLYKDHHGGVEEPHFQYIQHLAEQGLSKVGHHGRIGAMGVPRDDLPKWDQIQLLTAQLHKLPLLDDDPVGTTRENPPSRRRVSRTGTTSITTGALPERFGRPPAVSRSASNYPRSTSSETSRPRFRLASITSSSTVAAAALGRRR